MNKVRVIKNNGSLMLADKNGLPLEFQTGLKIVNDTGDRGKVRVVVEFMFDTDEFKIEEINK